MNNAKLSIKERIQWCWEYSVAVSDFVKAGGSKEQANILIAEAILDQDSLKTRVELN